MQHVQVDASSIGMFGHGEFIRLTHKPTGIMVEYKREENAISAAVRERLMAQLKVLVENYEPEPVKPS